MVQFNQKNCPKCGGRLKHYDTVKRIVRIKYGGSYYTKLQRMICDNCNAVHRELPYFLMPYKHYEKQIIYGFIFCTLSSDMLEYEDYPCISTVQKWSKSIPPTCV